MVTNPANEIRQIMVDIAKIAGDGDNEGLTSDNIHKVVSWMSRDNFMILLEGMINSGAIERIGPRYRTTRLGWDFIHASKRIDDRSETEDRR